MSNVVKLNQPPHNVMAEQAVLGALMIDQSAFARVQPALGESDFYIGKHKFLYRAISHLNSKNDAVDMVTVVDFLRTRNRLEDVGLDYVGSLVYDSPGAANIGSYAGVIKRCALQREMYALFNHYAGQCLDGGEKDAYAVLAEAQDALFKLSQDALRGRRDFARLSEVLTAQVNQLEALCENPPSNGVMGVASGFAGIDKMTRGFQGGDLIVLAARPSMGKSALAMNIAENAALSGKPVAVFSLEMSAMQLAQRLLSGSSGLPMYLLQQPWTIYDSGWPKITTGLARLNQLPIWLNDAPIMKASEIRALCMRLDGQLREEYPDGLGLIVIDYLQLMTFESKNSNRSEGLGDITRSLKQVAKEFQVPVLLLSQLNRDLEKRPDKRPHLSDLRDSGAIEQDADIVMFVYRDERYDEHSLDKGKAEIIFGKQRNGALGSVTLGFDGKYAKFRDLEG
jgi:replicative DNA helicase